MAAGSPGWLTAAPRFNVDIVTDGTSVYWALGQQLYGCKLASCTPALVDSSTGPSGGLEIDAAHVCWGTATTIRRLDL